MTQSSCRRVRPASGVFRGRARGTGPNTSLEDSDEHPTLSDFSTPGHWPCRQFRPRLERPKAVSTPGPGEPTLTEVRRLTERFRDVNVALAEGYIRDPFDMCETAEMMGRPAALGAMGIHFFRPDLLGITRPPSPRVSGTGTHTDFRQPSILIYEPKADGSLELVAVENLVFADAWRAAGHIERPTFHGVPYDAMADDPSTPSTRRTCSNRTSTAMSGSIARTRTACSHR